MTKQEYQEYLKTAHWQKIRTWVLTFWDGRCALCNSDQDVDVHHRYYGRLWRENLTDCIALCRDHHTLYHNIPSVRAYEAAALGGD